MKHLFKNDKRKSWMSWGLSRKQVGVFYKNGNLDLFI